MYAQMSSPRFSKRRRNPAPAIIIAVILLLLGCWIFNMTCGGGEEVETSAVTEYINRVRPIIDASTSLGQQWNTIMETLPQLMADMEGLDSQLESIAEQNKQLLEEAEQIEVPKGMEMANSALLMCLDQRYRAIEKLRPDLINALTSVEVDVWAENISEDLQELVYSDGSYRYFKRDVSEVLEDNNISDVILPDSIWVANWEIVLYENVKALLVALKGTELHGLAIGVVTLNPEGRIDDENIHRLPSTEEVSVTVNIENQGNRTETNVLVSVSLYSDTEPTPNDQEQNIESIGPGETVQVTFQGLRPTTGGVRNILEIKVAPVPQEEFVDNNQKLIYFTVE